MWQDSWTGKTIGSALREAVRRYGDRQAYVFQNETLTLRQLEERSDQLARGFLSLGVRKGDRVAIWMAGYAEWAYVYFALAKIGAIMVPLNTRFKPGELRYALEQSKSSLLIFKDEDTQGKDYSAILKELLPGWSSRSQKTSAELPHLRRIIAITHRRLPEYLSFADVFQAGSSVATDALGQAERDVTENDVAIIQFTSGTTATPKGAMLYQVAMLRGAYYCCLPFRLSERDRFFTPQPFFHVGGSIKVMLGPIVTGCTMVVQPYFEPGEALYLMEKENCNSTMGHQPHYIEYLNHPELKKRKLNLEKALIFAPPEINQRVREELGIDKLISPYGMTETHIGGTSCDLDDLLAKRTHTVGRPMIGVEMAIRASEGEEFLSTGQTGEVCFRGWCVTKGYYDDPEKTAAAIDGDGWFRTGDLGTVDADGFLTLRGRIKDMIRVGGENFAASGVETFLLGHHKIKQAVVTAMPDPRLGEVCAAFIELKSDASSTQEEILGYCRDGLASFKVPRKIVFVKEWPMSGTGKIQKYVLRDSLAGAREAGRT